MVVAIFSPFLLSSGRHHSGRACESGGCGDHGGCDDLVPVVVVVAAVTVSSCS